MTTLEQFPDALADTVYDKMLDDMTGRNVPILTLDDCLGLADACPNQFTTDRIRRLGQLLRVMVPAEQELWLKRALEKGTRRLGRDKDKRLTTGRILLHADFGDLARQYLPPAAEAAKIEEQEVRDEILKFLTAREETEESQQAKLADLWKEKLKTLGDPQADRSAKQRATDGLAEMLSKAPAGLWESWIRNLVREDAAAGLRLASTLGKITLAKQNDSDTTLRANNLRARRPCSSPRPGRPTLPHPPGTKWRWRLPMGGSTRRNRPPSCVPPVVRKPASRRSTSWTPRRMVLGPKHSLPRCGSTSTSAFPRRCW